MIKQECIKKECYLHIRYNKNISIVMLNDILSDINKAINDVNRDNGIGNRAIGDYAPVINTVEKGSIIIGLVLLLAKEIALPLLVDYIRNRFSKKHNNDINININANKNVNVSVRVDNDNNINIDIDN